MKKLTVTSVKDGFAEVAVKVALVIVALAGVFPLMLSNVAVYEADVFIGIALKETVPDENCEMLPEKLAVPIAVPFSFNVTVADRM